MALMNQIEVMYATNSNEERQQIMDRLQALGK